MPLITDIAQQKKRQQRVSVFLDEKFWTGMSATLLAEFDLKIGQQIDAETKSKVEKQIAEEEAMAAATHLLSYRDRSVEELKKRLADKGFGPEVIIETLQRLEEYGYLDDQGFAVQLAETQLARNKGRRAAAYALRQSGVEAELIEQALDRVYGADEELESALAWLSRKPKPEDAAAKQKLLRGLAGRGFDFSLAQQAVQIHCQGD